MATAAASASADKVGMLLSEFARSKSKTAWLIKSADSRLHSFLPASHSLGGDTVNHNITSRKKLNMTIKKLLDTAAYKTFVLQIITECESIPELKFSTNANGKPVGFTGAQKAYMLSRFLVENVFTEATPQEFAEVVGFVQAFGNDSQVRQGLESADILAEQAGGKRGVDFAAMAKGWTQKAKEATAQSEGQS